MRDLAAARRFAKARRQEFALALTFLTRVRLPDVGKLPAGAFGRSMAAFPVVGALIGAAGAAVLWSGLSVGLSAPVAALGAIALQIHLTGALHEDGLADVADGLGGGRDREAKLTIMRDSRLGTYGALALMIGLSARVLTIGDLAADALLAMASLVAAGAASRAVLAAVAWATLPARSDGLAATAARPSATVAGLSMMIGAAVALIAVGPSGGLVSLAVGAAAAALLAWLAARQVGGYTGDVLGACQQVAEIAMLLTLSALL